MRWAPIFAQGLVYAPDREWAAMVMEEMATFPKGRYKDLTDSATQALKHLRAINLIQNSEEFARRELARSQYRPKLQPLYPV